MLDHHSSWAEVGEAQQTGPNIIQKQPKKDSPDQAKDAKLHMDDKRATLIRNESRWSSRLGTELCSRSHLGKGSYDSVSGEIKRLKRSRIPLVKVRWNSRRGPEFTWEREDSF
ncbi:hypothetical protein Tco_1553595 [Tanacetum coccineum]